MTAPMLKMFDPTTLPTAISTEPRTAAITDVASSGSEVPTATTVRPMTRSLMPSAVATSVAPLTIHRAPRTRRATPAATLSRSRTRRRGVRGAWSAGTTSDRRLPRTVHTT